MPDVDIAEDILAAHASPLDSLQELRSTYSRAHASVYNTRASKGVYNTVASNVFEPINKKGH